MQRRVFLGVDVGTSSSKGVLVTPGGAILRSAVREHSVQRPRPGFVEMDALIWWDEFVSMASELTAPGDVAVAAVGVSGMGHGDLLVVADANFPGHRISTRVIDVQCADAPTVMRAVASVFPIDADVPVVLMASPNGRLPVQDELLRAAGRGAARGMRSQPSTRRRTQRRHFEGAVARLINVAT